MSVLFSSRTFPKLYAFFYQDTLQKELIASPNTVKFNFNYFEDVVITGSLNLTITLNS